MKTLQKIIMADALALALTLNAFAQTNLQFTSINVTDEGAIQFYWNSQSNHLYEIDEADALIDTNTGSITWNKLYDDYPSQGTNTFIGDFGNYNLAPQILHPKNAPMRFYRVVDEGADSLASDEPTVSISSPTNSALVFGELTITVVAVSDQLVLAGTELYVDGQKMHMADSITNYTDGSGLTNYEVDTYSINTCEWENGTHVLFATTECLSSPEGENNGSQSLTGHAVSPIVSATFNNLVTRISFSQPSFDPSSGQTQQVSAVFPLNSDWTLNIVDVYSNVVQAATGSGNSMLYNWDGTSNGTNLPNGIYFYYITAATNGLANEPVGGGSGEGGGGSPPIPLFESAPSQLWAVASDSENVVPLAIYPPGSATNGLTIFEASSSEVRSLMTLSARVGTPSAMGNNSASPNGIGDPGYVTPLPDPQPAPPAPKRPPNNPIKGFSGTVGIAYQRYLSWTNGYAPTAPLNGILTQHVALQGAGGNNPVKYYDMHTYQPEADNFLATTKQYGLNVTLNKVDDQLNINDLRGSGTPFNNVNLGVLMLHGTYGTGLDYTANGCEQMYFPIGAGGGATYLRMSEMNLGGAGTNGLKWMAIMACFSLYHTDWQNMQSAGVHPYNSNLHLLLGCDTTEYTSPNLMAYWVKYMSFGASTNYAPLSIRNAWYQAARQAYADESNSIPSGIVIKFTVAGDTACSDDSLTNNSSPGGTWFYDTPIQVFP